jgi:hypothetical protein
MSLGQLCSSRDASAFAWGAVTLARGSRPQAVLNSLSLDFIAAASALLREGGGFVEIGKRGVWAPLRHAASAPSTEYSAIALDVDVARDPTWMQSVLALLSARADQAVVASLPLEASTWSRSLNLPSARCRAD